MTFNEFVDKCHEIIGPDRGSVCISIEHWTYRPSRSVGLTYRVTVVRNVVTVDAQGHSPEATVEHLKTLIAKQDELPIDTSNEILNTPLPPGDPDET